MQITGFSSTELLITDLLSMHSSLLIRRVLQKSICLDYYNSHYFDHHITLSIRKELSYLLTVTQEFLLPVSLIALLFNQKTWSEMCSLSYKSSRWKRLEIWQLFQWSQVRGSCSETSRVNEIQERAVCRLSSIEYNKRRTTLGIMHVKRRGVMAHYELCLH